MNKVFVLLVLIILSLLPVCASPQNPGHYTSERYQFPALDINSSTYLPMPNVTFSDRVTLISIKLKLTLVNLTLHYDFLDITELLISTPGGTDFLGNSTKYTHYLTPQAVLNQSITIAPNENTTIFLDAYSVWLTHLGSLDKLSELSTLDNEFQIYDWHSLGPGANVIIWFYSTKDYDLRISWKDQTFNFSITANQLSKIEFTLNNDSSQLASGNYDDWKAPLNINHQINITSYFALSPNNGVQNANYTVVPLNFGVFLISVGMLVILKRRNV